jgi:Ser/Thr protein kinase RdoA (MazF antagonist)
VVSGFELGECELESINHEFNSTFKVTSESGEIFALRINVNSQRTLQKLNAELFWVEQLAKLENIKVPSPIRNSKGEFITAAFHPLLNRDLLAVMFTWLEGQELGDEPTPEMMQATGRMMANLHLASRHTKLPPEAELPVITDMFWGGEDFIKASNEVTEAHKATIADAIERIELVTAYLFSSQKPQLIHADIHPWNVMWQEGDVAIFDFDDCVIGLPVQDIAVTLYYNDTKEQDDAFLAGYREVMPLPVYSDEQMKALLLQRRIFLLNYLLETENPEHRAMVPEYLEKTIARVSETFGHLPKVSSTSTI